MLHVFCYRDMTDSMTDLRDCLSRAFLRRERWLLKAQCMWSFKPGSKFYTNFFLIYLLTSIQAFPFLMLINVFNAD